MFLLAFAESIQLFPDGTLFIHIALILVMIWVLNRTFFRPINRIIESREKHKGGAGGEAESIMRDVAEKQAIYNRTMLEARSEGYETIEKQRAQAIAERAAQVAAAKEETARAFAKEKEELQSEAAAAKATIASEAEVMADKIAANILRA
jgi:F0F1-type ATP synthase membrane subunit b/b'